MSSHHSSNSAFDLVQEFSLPLIVGVITALAWANLDPEGYHHLIHWSPFGADSHLNLHFLANDIFMVLFFGIAAKEIVEACLPGGALNPPRRAINPLMATLGGVFGPVAAYFLWIAATNDWSIANGWGVPTATDIALAWLVARLVFGPTHPAVSFLLLLAVVDDGLGLGIIAIFYPDPVNPVRPVFFVLIVAACALAYAMKRKGVTNYWAYLIGPGVLSWCGLFLSHLHPALALVVVVPFMPHAKRDEGIFAEMQSVPVPGDTLNQFEHAFKGPVDFGLFGFGLANAGVMFSTVGNATWGIFVALVVGKMVGIYAFAMVGKLMGFPLPEGMNKRSLLVTGLIAGIGLTVALFVSGVAFTDPTLQGAAKMGALLSAVAAPMAIGLARVLGIRRQRAKSAEERAQPESEVGTAKPKVVPA